MSNVTLDLAQILTLACPYEDALAVVKIRHPLTKLILHDHLEGSDERPVNVRFIPPTFVFQLQHSFY